MKCDADTNGQESDARIVTAGPRGHEDMGCAFNRECYLDEGRVAICIFENVL